MLVFKQWVGEKGMASIMSCVMGHLSMLGMAIISMLDIAMGGTDAPVTKVEECHRMRKLQKTCCSERGLQHL